MTATVQDPSAEILPFRIEIPQAALDDLTGRLRRASWPDELPGAGDSYGQPGSRVRALARYWLEEYDWRATEARLNTYPQFKTEIEGESIHFMHVRSSRPDATPQNRRSSCWCEQRGCSTHSAISATGNRLWRRTRSSHRR